MAPKAASKKPAATAKATKTSVTKSAMKSVMKAKKVKVLRKPSSSVSKLRNGEPVPPKELLEAAEQLTQYDKRKFKAEAMQNIPTILKEDIEGLKGEGYGMDKTKKINLRIAAWKQGGWTHPYFTDLMNWSDTRTKGKMEKAVPWLRMCAKVGGEENAKTMLKDGEIQAVKNPDNPEGKPYFKFVEFHVSRKHQISREKGLGATRDLGALGDECWNEAQHGKQGTDTPLTTDLSACIDTTTHLSTFPPNPLPTTKPTSLPNYPPYHFTQLLTQPTTQLHT